MSSNDYAPSGVQIPEVNVKITYKAWDDIDLNQLYVQHIIPLIFELMQIIVENVWAVETNNSGTPE